MRHAEFGILGSVFISLFSIVLLSSTNASFSVLIEEKDDDMYGIIYYIGTQNNNNPLSTILNSRDVLYYTNRGDKLFDEREYDQAITYYDKALSIDPHDYVALYNKGVALPNLGKYEEAITYYDKVLALDPGNTDALTNKGISLSKLGEYDASSADQFASSNTTNRTLNSFKDSKTGLSFQYPSDWEVASDEYLQSIGGAPENLIVLMIPKSLDASTMAVLHRELHLPLSDEFLETAKKSITDDGSSVSDAIPVSIGSLDGYEFNVTATDDTHPSLTQVILAKDLEAFIITYGISETDKEENRDIEAMIDSFKVEDDVSENGISIASSNGKDFDNAKDKTRDLLTYAFNSIFPETGDKFTNNKYGVDITFPKNWTGIEWKTVFPLAIVSPEEINVTSLFSAEIYTIVDSIAEEIVSGGNLTELAEQKMQELKEPVINKLLEYFEGKTSSMAVYIYDKQFAKLTNSFNPNGTIPIDSQTSLYERHIFSEPTNSNCFRKSLDQITLHNNIPAERATDQCFLGLDGNKKQDNIHYFVLTPNAVVYIRYTYDPDKGNDKFLQEFEEALKTLSIKETLPINNQTIQQFLRG